MSVPISGFDYKSLVDFMKELVNFYLGDHDCLDLEDISRQMLGGPTRAKNGDDCECLA